MRIVVNGRPVVIDASWITYEDIANMVQDAPAVRNPVLTVTYRHGSVMNPEGSLGPGQKVPVRTGMIFNATITSNA